MDGIVSGLLVVAGCGLIILAGCSVPVAHAPTPAPLGSLDSTSVCPESTAVIVNDSESGLDELIRALARLLGDHSPLPASPGRQH